MYLVQDPLQVFGVGETTAEEDGLSISRAYDIIYGFILGQEVHVRAELFDQLDRLYYWARKAAGDANTAEAKATGSPSPTSASASSAIDWTGTQMPMSWIAQKIAEKLRSLDL